MQRKGNGCTGSLACSPRICRPPRLPEPYLFPFADAYETCQRRSKIQDSKENTDSPYIKEWLPKGYTWSRRKRADNLRPWELKGKKNSVLANQEREKKGMKLQVLPPWAITSLKLCVILLSCVSILSSLCADCQRFREKWSRVSIQNTHRN